MQASFRLTGTIKRHVKSSRLGGASPQFLTTTLRVSCTRKLQHLYI
ncbi:hypothetical protein Plhal304r1_c045g0125851 [Plasmopara halstedii]